MTGMEYRWLGRTGLRISCLGLGSSPFGSRMGAVSGVGRADADRIVGRALELGVNYFDTSDVYSYGEAEERLGQALGRRRQDVLLSTKSGFRVSDSPNHAGASRTHLMRQLDSSLARLGTDYVDLFFVHIYDEHADQDDVMLTLDLLVRAGKVRYAGASNYPAWCVAEANEIARQRGGAPFAVYQGLWNLLARDVEDELVPMCRSRGLGFLAWSPLAGGLLTGKYRRGEERPDGSRLADPQSDEARFLRHDWEHAYDVVELLEEIGEPRGASAGQVALAWQLAQPGLCAAVVGARTLEQLEDNLGAVEVALEPGELERIDALSPAQARWPRWQIESNRRSRVKGVAH